MFVSLNKAVCMKLNKPLKIVATVLSSAIALIIFVIMYLMILEVLKGRFRGYDDIVVFCGIFIALLACAFSMLPIHKIIKRFIDKSSKPLIQKLSPTYLTIIAVIRTQVVVAVLFITLATARKWSDAVQYIVPVPVGEKQMKDWEKMISMGQSSSVYSDVTRLTNYSKRVNMVRLGIKNLKSVFEHAKSNNTFVSMDDLNHFSTLDSLREITSGNYDKSTAAKFISSNDLIKLLSSIALSVVSNGSDEISNDLISIITTIKPDSPDILQLRGDILWSRSDVCDAREVYKQYAESVRKTNQLAALPQNIQEIIDIKDKWNISYAPLIARSWIESSPYSFSGSSMDNSEPLKLRNKNYGSFNSELVNIYHSSTLGNYLRLFTSDCRSSSIDVWEYISSYKPGTYDEELQFNKVNSSFITWVQDHMVPSPSAKFANTTFQTLYNKSFRNIVRTYKMAHRYVTLTGINDLASNYSSSYNSDPESEDYVDGYNYLLRTFGNISFTESTINSYTISSIIGFWLRRYLDDSESAVATCMDFILSKYDQAFLNKINNIEEYNAFTTISEEEENSEDEQESDDEGEEYGD